MSSRYRAPAEEGGLFADPPLSRIGSQLEANATLLDMSPVHIAGVPLAEFRRRAADEALAASRRYLVEGGEPVPPGAPRLLVAGHQPDFFHPGVWVKKFVLHALAVRHGRAPLNLVVDNDMVKSAAIRVPAGTDDPAAVHAVPVPFDRPKGDRPHEEYHVEDRALFDSFPDRLHEHSRSWGFEPLADRVWPMIAAELDRGATLGTAASRVRRSLERRWGVTNFELPVGRLADTRAFAGFVETILDDLPRFRDCYNAAIRGYRKSYHLRSQNHPAPELGGRGDTLEAPFWIWKTGGRRERLFVGYAGGGDATRTLLAGQTPVCRLPPGGRVSGDCLGNQREGGWKVRPRALTLTLFARVGLGDGFVHGIGGGKYDEVTDEIIRRYFGLEPPGYAVVSATRRLPLRRFAATPETLHAAERCVRDLEWNPQRFPEARARFPELVARKAALIREEPAARSDRRRWFRQLQQLTRDMRPAVAGRLAQAEADANRVRAELAANAVLASREYAWPLFPEAVLRDYFAQFR